MVSADFVLSVEFCSDLVLSFRQTMNMVAHGIEVANLVVVKNAAVLAEELQKGGLKLITGGTSNHLILADVHGSFGIDGKEAQERLEKAGITTNANAIPDEPLPPFRPSGLRLGTPALTTRGYREGDMIEITHTILDTLRT